VDILIASRCLPWPPHHGDRLILCHLLPELMRRGHACDVVALTAPEDDAEAAERSAALCRDLETVPEKRRSAWRYLGRLRQPFPRSVDESWNPEMWRAVERRLRSRRYDVIHLFGGVQVYEMGALGVRVPTIIVPYESYSLFLERALADEGGFVTRLRLLASLAVARRYERVMFRGYDRVVVLAAHDRDALLRLAPGLPVEIIPNGVRLPDVPRARCEPPEIVFVGNFAYPPNVRAAAILAREVFPEVRRTRPRTGLSLVGANPPAAIQKLAGSGVEVTGRVTSIGPWLARAAAFVAPITMGSGIKNKVLEAMAAGCPVVTTPLGCEGLAAVDGEHLLLGTTAAQLAAAAGRLLDDRALADRLGKAGRAFVEAHHSWAGVATKYEDLYSSVIAQGSGRGR
jgi:glycosyltransferase involved in cell wall biosynthesis